VLDSKALFINVTGNHDIGYGHEITEPLVNNFEKSFGPVNKKFIVGGHVIANLNSLNLDSSRNLELQQKSKQFLKSLRNSKLPVLLATHIPMHKDPSPCSDQPRLMTNGNGHVVSQNFLSPETTQEILTKLSPAAIFTGHDHEGCYFEHVVKEKLLTIPEYTVRSMMGDFDGNAALFEAIKVPNPNGSGDRFRYLYGECKFVQLRQITYSLTVFGIWIGLLLCYSLLKLRVPKTSPVRFTTHSICGIRFCRKRE